MKAIRYKDETLGAESIVETIPETYESRARELREQLIEKVAESNDVLLDKYVHGENITEDEIRTAIYRRVLELSLIHI